jgi:hypothetical protein
LQRLQQGFATGEMGFRGPAAKQQFGAANVRFGSKADMRSADRRVRFGPILLQKTVEGFFGQ